VFFFRLRERVVRGAACANAGEFWEGRDRERNNPNIKTNPAKLTTVMTRPSSSCSGAPMPFVTLTGGARHSAATPL
jgi:hypothetical protein